MVLWIYKWFRPDGAIDAQTISREMQDLLFSPLQAEPAPPRPAAPAGGKRRRR